MLPLQAGVGCDGRRERRRGCPRRPATALAIGGGAGETVVPSLGVEAVVAQRCSWARPCRPAIWVSGLGDEVALEGEVAGLGSEGVAERRGGCR